MYQVTVDGSVRVWQTFEYALKDALVRGYGKAWTLERILP